MGGLIPLGDASRRPAHFPVVTGLIIVINVCIFVLELMRGDSFLLQWSAIPAQITSGHHWVTILTAMFMHGSWSHILGNMIFFWAFGPEIEDAMKPVRFLVFYLAGGAAAMLSQVAVIPHSTVPNLGASGAIAAVMGAFLVTYPRDRIKSVLIVGWFMRITFVPAALLIGLWFLLQLFSAGAVTNMNTGGVAYAAHIGGMIFGAVTAHFFESSSAERGYS